MTTIELTPDIRAPEADLTRWQQIRALPETFGRITHTINEDLEETGAAEMPGVRHTLAAVAIAGAFGKDFKSKSRREFAAAGLTAVCIGGVEAVGFTRIPSAEAISLPVNFCEHHHIPLIAAGVGTAVGSWAWANIAARTLNGGVNHLPRTFETINERVGHTDGLSHLLPGLDPEDQPRKERWIPGSLKQGSAIYSAGILSYILSAAAQNQEPHERARLCGKLGWSNALFLGLIAMTATGTASTAELIQGPDSKIAANIINVATNNDLLLEGAWGIAGLTIARKLLPKIPLAARKLDGAARNWIATKRRDTPKSPPAYEQH
jgi:hypothetical protein